MSDSILVGIASGHIMIFDSETGHLLTWFHPFDNTRSLTLINSPGSSGTEQGYVISTGKGLKTGRIRPGMRTFGGTGDRNPEGRYKS